MQITTTPGKQHEKSQLTLSVRSKLKQQVKDEIEYSSMTFSALMEQKMIEFLEDTTSVPKEVRTEDMEEYVCPECEAIATDAVLDKTGDQCPKCETELDR